MAILLLIFLFLHKVQCGKNIYSYLSQQVRKWDYIPLQIHKNEYCFNKKWVMHKIKMFICVNKYCAPNTINVPFSGNNPWAVTEPKIEL